MFKPCCMVAVACVSLCGTALAADITWTGLRDGTSFGNSGNWSPMNVPGQSDTAIFNISFPLVTLGSSVENERLSVLPFGDGTLSLTGNSYSLLGFGPASIEVEGTVTISDGQLFSTKGALIHPSGSMTLSDLQWVHSGGLDIQGSLSLSPVPGPSSTFVTIDEFLNIRGSGICDGRGSSLTISNNAFVFAHDDFAVGTDAGASSLTLQSGSSLVLTGLPFQSVRLAQHLFSCVTATVDDAQWFIPGGLFVGEAGSASLTIQNNGNVICSEARIANKSDSVGTVTVTGTASQNTHTSWEISGNLHVGDGGTGSLLIENGAEVNSGSGRIGQEDGLPGTVTVTGSDSDWEIVGALDISPGDLTISAGGFVSSGDGFIGGGEAGSATVTGGGSAWFNTGLFIIGTEGTGSLDIADSGLVLSDSGFLGLFPGTSGTVTVDGAGSNWIDLSDVFVGYNGSGTLNITNGGSVSNTAGFVGSFAGSNGTALVDGLGSTWTNLVSLAVGNFGAGSLTVSNGGTVAAPQITISDTGEVHGDGTLAGNVTNSGLASPGLSIGTLNIQGDYLQTPNGVLDIELSASGGDRLAITGQAELSFPTLMLSVVSGDEPSVGQMFTILTAATIKGQDFTVIDDGGQYTVTYSSTDIVVTVVSLPPPPPSTADITGPLAVPDGCVDAFDLGAMLGAWCSGINDPNPPSPPCENCTPANLAVADISGAAMMPDGCVDAFDLAKLLAEWCSVAGGNPCGTCFPPP